MSSDTCFGGSTCVPVSSDPFFRCICPSGKTGVRCDVDNGRNQRKQNQVLNVYFDINQNVSLYKIQNCKNKFHRVLFQDFENNVTTPPSAKIMLLVTQLIRPCCVFADLDTRVLRAQKVNFLCLKVVISCVLEDLL